MTKGCFYQSNSGAQLRVLHADNVLLLANRRLILPTPVNILASHIFSCLAAINYQLATCANTIIVPVHQNGQGCLTHVLPTAARQHDTGHVAF